MPTPTAVICPSWCSPRHCDAGTHVDIRHSGTPTVLRASADDAQITLAPHRDDEHTRDGRYRPSVHGIAVDIRGTGGSVWPDGAPIRADAFLTPGEARTLARRLLALAELTDTSEGAPA